jgi:hypothetical protein
VTNIFRPALARAAALAVEEHTGYKVQQREIDFYVNATGYPATLRNAVDILSFNVGDLDGRDFRDMEAIAAKHFMRVG